jgi:hypothetical protein
MKDCYYDLELHFILLDDYSQSYILKLRDWAQSGMGQKYPSLLDGSRIILITLGERYKCLNGRQHHPKGRPPLLWRLSRL